MNISMILEKKWAIPAAVGVVSLGVGFGAGYMIGRRNSYVEYRYAIDADVYKAKTDPNQQSLFEATDGEAVDTEVDYSTVEVHPDFVDNLEPESIVVNERNDPSKIVVLGQDDEPPEPVSINIFENPAEPWDYQKELASRTPHDPYIIHRDEYYEDLLNYRQETLTYYEGDEVMTDPADTPIPNFKQILGDNLAFGHGSGDPSVVYIRNDEREMEWEILRHPSRYEVEVLGLEIQSEYERGDLKHGSGGKFRMDE
jgi:hypothetical protein